MKKIPQFFKNLFGGYSKGEISGYWIGYEVAKEEFTVKYDIEVNLYDDFNNYRKELKDDYGIDYVLRTEQFFAQFANLREPLQVYLVAHKNHSKLLKSYQVDGYRIIHLIKMLTDIYLRLDDSECLGKAKSYAKLGLNLLNQDEPYYDSLLRIFSGYKKLVMEKEWENN